MTTLTAPILPRSRPVRSTLTADPEQLAAMAEELNGRAVPGVRMTERQFVEWSTPGALRAEWENGEVILMTTPSTAHVDLDGWLYRFLFAFVEFHDLGVVYLPLAVRLAEIQRRRDPDVLFVAKARMHLLRKNHLEGPPDLAVEIVSPDSAVRDWRTKHAEYAAAGVREYWVADPLIRRFEAYALHRKKYRLLPTDDDGRVHSKLLKGLHVKPAWLWRSPLPRVSTVLKEIGVR
jgi:Uma2 family endonuclease